MGRVHKIVTWCVLLVSLLVSASVAQNSGDKPKADARAVSTPVVAPPTGEEVGAVRGVDIRARVPSQVLDELGKYHAVLIGINEYVEMPRLKTPVKDVEALEKVLRGQYGFEDIILITDKTEIKPTAKNIVNVLREKAASLSDADNLLVYFAGHGEQDKLIDESYWIPIEGRKDDTTTWIAHTSIRSLLETNNIKVKNFILIADSCYSGNLTRAVLTGDEVGEKEAYARIHKLKEMASKKSREVITSGSNEPVQDAVKGSSHSLFAHYLLKALDENPDKFSDVATLFNQKIKPEIDPYGMQTPDRSRVRSAVDAKGLFVLVKINAKDLPPKIDPIQEIKNRDAKIAELQSQLAEVLGRYATLQSSSQDKDKELQKLANDITQKNREAADLKKSLEEGKVKLAAERSRLETEHTDLLKQQTKLDEKAKQIVAEEIRLKDLAKTGDMVSGASAELEKLKTKLSEEKNILEADAKKLQEKERTQAAYFEKLRAQELTQADLVKKLQEREKSLAELDEKYKNGQKQKDQEITSLKEKIDKLTQKLAEEKGVKPPSNAEGRFLVLDTVVIDSTTGLMWLKNATSTSGKTYDEAVVYVDNLNYDGYAEWRLPTTGDIETLIGKGLDKSYPDGHPFENVLPNLYFWSSSNVSQRPLIYNAATGNSMGQNKNKTGYVWPVRDASPDEIKKALSQKTPK